MLIGTAFLMSSNQYRKGMKEQAKQDRIGNYPTKLLDRAVMQILRDTDNPQSAIRYHSLLRDLYGTDGFEAQVDRRNLRTRKSQLRRSTTLSLGATQGQLIDIIRRARRVHATRQHAPPTSPPMSSSSIVIRMASRNCSHPACHCRSPKATTTAACSRSPAAQPRASRHAIVDYEYVGDQTHHSLFPAACCFQTIATATIWRFRVMTFPRTDGSSLQLGRRALSRRAAGADRTSLGATFIVNGRPFNGTGVGYNSVRHRRPAHAQRRRGHQQSPANSTDDDRDLPRNRSHAQLDLLLPV